MIHAPCACSHSNFMQRAVDQRSRQQCQPVETEPLISMNITAQRGLIHRQWVQHMALYMTWKMWCSATQQAQISRSSSTALMMRRKFKCITHNANQIGRGQHRLRLTGGHTMGRLACATNQWCATAVATSTTPIVRTTAASNMER